MTGDRLISAGGQPAGPGAAPLRLTGSLARGLSLGLTRPLAGLTATMRRLRAGEPAPVPGLTGTAPAQTAQAQEVARALTALAAESERLRSQEARRSRLLAVARDAGFRIREHLQAQDVVGEARQVLAESIDADAVYLHIMRDGVLGPPEGPAGDWLLPETFLSDIARTLPADLADMARNKSSTVTQDLTGPEGERLPPEVREPLRAIGAVSLLLTPFGGGTELLGLVAALRLHPGHPWADAEVAAVEWIAADIGWALHHARLDEAEARLVQQLQKVDRAKSDFFATVSHELRTPLTSIAGYLEILRDLDAGPLTAAQAHMLATVDRNTSRLRHLVEDVLTLSRIESGTFRAVKIPVNLADVIATVVAALRPAAARNDVSLSLAYHGPDASPPAAGGAGRPVAGDPALVVAGDPGQLDRMLMNLVSNAVKFTPAGGQVRVQAGTRDGWAAVTVSDTGLGIPAADQKELFTRFFRASNVVSRSIPGTGLGLAIVRTIVDNHGGRIEIQSQEGAGTTVRAQIPLLAGGGSGDAGRPLPPGQATDRLPGREAAVGTRSQHDRTRPA